MKRLILFAALLCAAPFADAADRAFPRGAVATPRHKLLAAPQHRVVADPPEHVAYVPATLSYWGNDRYGDCVSAEEAFCKACYHPEILIPDSEVVLWARQNGYLHGADLSDVMRSMAKRGFAVGNQLYNDGPYSSVDYSNETVLKSAIAQGPVKIAIDADALPSGAGNKSGWFATVGGHYPNTDHCVSICGYGAADYLYSQLQVSMPAELAGTSGYLVFTWSTIGYVSHDWIMSTTAEAWVRNPTTVGVPPLPSPTPTPVPTPTPTPVPTPTPTPVPTSLTFSDVVSLVIATGKHDLTQDQATRVATFFSDDNSPRVKLVETIAYRKATREGKIPAGTSIDAVDWQGLIEFIQALVPIIEELVVLFGDQPTAVIEADEASAIADVFELRTEPARPSLITLAASPQYRTECGPNGCRRVLVSPTSPETASKPATAKAKPAPVRSAPKQPTKPARRFQPFKNLFNR
jgi:hypothetical protein